MKRTMVLLALGAALAFVAVPGASSAHGPTSCNGVTNEAAGATTTDLTVVNPLDSSVIAYLNTDSSNDTEAGHTPSLFLESNGWDGLQTHAHTCRTGPEGSPFITIDADTEVGPLPIS
jgi:hypothetical protein